MLGLVVSMYGVTKKEISISGFILHILLSEGAERAGQGRLGQGKPSVSGWGDDHTKKK